MRKPLAIAVLTLLGTTAFAAGEVYRWRDANGIWNYSDQPRPGAELVKAGKPASDSNTPPATQTAATTPATPPPASSDTPLPVSKEVAEEVRKEAATAKAEACTKAKADYDRYVKAPAIYKIDAQGKQVYMNNAEIDAARLQARANRDLACGP